LDNKSTLNKGNIVGTLLLASINLLVGSKIAEKRNL